MGNCHNPKGYLACECVEIMAVGSQDPVIDKGTEASSSEFFYIITANTPKITISKYHKITTRKHIYD